MTYVSCRNCGYNVQIDISKAVDEDGEVFICDRCGFKFRYAEK